MTNSLSSLFQTHMNSNVTHSERIEIDPSRDGTATCVPLKNKNTSSCGSQHSKYKCHNDFPCHFLGSSSPLAKCLPLPFGSVSLKDCVDLVTIESVYESSLMNGYPSRRHPSPTLAGPEPKRRGPYSSRSRSPTNEASGLGLRPALTNPGRPLALFFVLRQLEH